MRPKIPKQQDFGIEVWIACGLTMLSGLGFALFETAGLLCLNPFTKPFGYGHVILALLYTANVGTLFLPNLMPKIYKRLWKSEEAVVLFLAICFVALWIGNYSLGYAALDILTEGWYFG